jgi:hypothetical protein
MLPVRPTSPCRRSQIFIDREVQGALMLRVGFYWLCCLLSIVLMVLCWNVVTGPPRRFVDLFAEIQERYAPALVASLILLPMVMIDVVRLSHRFVGPVVRLRGGLRELATQGQAKPIAFRDGDYWQELAADFNRVAERAESPATPARIAADELVIDDLMGSISS